MRQLIGLCVLLALLAAKPTSAADGAVDLPVYSIQVRAVSLAEQEDGMATYRQLMDKGYLTYTYRVEINEEPWLRIAVGAFGSRGAAAEFGRAFTSAEGMDHFVAAAPVLILPGAGEREFVVTPSALWVRGGDGAREVHVFAAEAPNGAGLPAAILPELAPGGQALAFVHGCRMLVAAVDGDAAVDAMEPGGPCVTAEFDLSYSWRPGWSPSGDYVAFLDQALWEYPIGLWVARADGGRPMCLACNRDGQSAVKWFVWHPSEDRVLFVEGFSWGTVAVGGRLFSAEMDGAITEIAAVERVGTDEIAGPLRIEEGRLHYRRVRWLDDNFEQKAITDESIPVDAL